MTEVRSIHIYVHRPVIETSDCSVGRTKYTTRPYGWTFMVANCLHVEYNLYIVC